MYYIKWLVIFLVAAFPALSIVLHNAGNACLFLLLLCGIVVAACRYKPMGLGFTRLLKEYWPLHVAMAALVVAVFLNQLSTGNFEAKQYDRGLRLAVFASVLWVILLVPLRYLKIVQWSFIAGVGVAAIKAYVLTHGGLERPSNIGFLSTIAFSNIALLLGTMAVLSIGWNEHRQRLVIALKILAFFIGIYTTVLTATRGSWLAIPPVLLFTFIFFGNIRIRYKLIVAILSLVLFGGVFSYSTAVQNRVAAAKSDITQYMNRENMDTSVGLRLQMWQASWLLFKERPIFGIGRENYSKGVKELAARKVITPAAAHFAHSHNELLFNMTISGIFGLLASLAIYCVPAFYFFREIRHADREIKTAAALGLVVCLCFFIYGFTDLMFFWTVLGAFYNMSVAIFLACIIKRKEEIRRSIIERGMA